MAKRCNWTFSTPRAKRNTLVPPLTRFPFASPPSLLDLISLSHFDCSTRTATPLRYSDEGQLLSHGGGLPVRVLYHDRGQLQTAHQLPRANPASHRKRRRTATPSLPRGSAPRSQPFAGVAIAHPLRVLCVVVRVRWFVVLCFFTHTNTDPVRGSGQQGRSRGQEAGDQAAGPRARPEVQRALPRGTSPSSFFPLYWPTTTGPMADHPLPRCRRRRRRTPT